jgi:hypothetical protein
MSYFISEPQARGALRLQPRSTSPYPVIFCEDARLIGGNPGLPCIGMEGVETPTRKGPPFCGHNRRRSGLPEEAVGSCGGVNGTLELCWEPVNGRDPTTQHKHENPNARCVGL